MKSPKLLFALLLTIFVLISCSGDSGGGGGGGPVLEEDGTTTGGTSGGTTGGTSGGTSGGTTGGSNNGADISIDSEMSPPERQALETSAKALGDFNINGSQLRWFSEIFGGPRSANVVNYIETRVNIALSAATNLESRAVLQPASSFVSMLTNLEVFASNPSFLLWYTAKVVEPDDLKFLTNGNLVDINSTRIGVMQFGDIYVSSDTALQAITLVHEARHSDCTGGALASDIERFRAGLIPLNAACGHLHEVCPPGHPLEGIIACDVHPWGAYVIDAIYSLAISENCSNCTPAQIQAAEINFFEVVQRPVFLEDLLNGEFGPPDMSSSNQVR